MTDLIKERNKIIQDLEKIYSLAMEAENFQSAIQAKKAIASINGFIKNKHDQITLQDLTNEQLEFLINEGEALLNKHHA